MTKHAIVYMDFFGYDKSDFIGCEICGKPCVDIHHLIPRSLCSKSEVNEIQNLIAVCREHHDQCHSSKEFNERAKTIHLCNIASKLLKD